MPTRAFCIGSSTSVRPLPGVRLAGATSRTTGAATTPGTLESSAPRSSPEANYSSCTVFTRHLARARTALRISWRSSTPGRAARWRPGPPFAPLPWPAEAAGAAIAMSRSRRSLTACIAAMLDGPSSSDRAGLGFRGGSGPAPFGRRIVSLHRRCAHHRQRWQARPGEPKRPRGARGRRASNPRAVCADDRPHGAPALRARTRCRRDDLHDAALRRNAALRGLTHPALFTRPLCVAAGMG
jgi:hypothetical protein